ncbi:MAG: hypothetical protein JRI36_09680 [Deltaproteobacteria bacterium]|nr:hypothetical protein [Deltaproteobacteria bacterium]
MKEERVTIRRLRLLPALFRKQDVEKITPHAGTFLSRAIKKGLIHRISRGNYINSFLHGFPPVEEIACFLKPPSYVSCEWALNYHGILLQSPTVCTALTLGTSVGRKRNIMYQGITIEFSRIAPALFLGFDRQDECYIATPEKAILDTLYYRKAIPTHDELELDGVDLDSLMEMAKLYPKSIRRLLPELFPKYTLNRIGA